MAKKQKTASSVEGFTFDADAADRAVAFFAECLTHTTGEWRGQPFILSDWQADIVRKIFGCKRPDGTRRYRTVFIAVPRKAGKTTLAAGLALYALYCDGKVVALICDDQFFLKPLPVALALVMAPVYGPPYLGAKPHLLLTGELNDPELMARLVRTVAEALPPPKPKKPKKK